MNFTNVSSFSFCVLCQTELNAHGNQVPGQCSTHSDQPRNLKIWRGKKNQSDSDRAFICWTQV